VVSLRKRPARVETDAPISAPPSDLKLTPEAPPQPEEPVAESNPVETASQQAMRERLRELENAETRQAVASPQMAQEQANPIDALLARSGLPEAAQSWLRAHPEYLADAKKNSELQYRHWIVKEETGEEFTPAYYEAMERHLGLRSDAPAQPAMRTAELAPPRRQTMGVLSAPISRESLSWSTGRPVNSGRVTLTPADLENAKLWGLTPQQLLEGKIKHEKEKAQGLRNERG
jgi:hypothetical protein